MIKEHNTPRLVISSLKGSCAKTVVSLAITEALRKRGTKVFPFKKGPDYIDATWLTRASGSICRHLDLFMMDEESVTESFVKHSDENGIAVTIRITYRMSVISFKVSSSNPPGRIGKKDM